eukprot:s1627_g18.t1
MDGVEEEPLEPEVGQRLVCGPSGNVHASYAPLVYTTPLGITIQCIVVAVVEDRFLVVFPHKAWHRQTTKRVLPSTLLSKPTLMAVICCGMEARNEPMEDITMKLWAGYMTAETFDLLTDIDLEKPMDYPLLTEDGMEGFLPFANSLADALQEHFVFLSAESAHGPVVESGLEPGLGVRVTNLEELMGKVSANMDELLSVMKTSPGMREQRNQAKPRVNMAEPPVRKVIPQSKQRATASSRFPLLDASVVSAALAAGVSEENLLEMQQMMANGLPKARKLREPALRTSSRTPAAQALSESEDEPEEQEGDAGLEAPSSPPTMEAAVGKLTELVSLLAADRVKKAKSSKVELALENVSSGHGGDSAGGGTLKRAAAARRALRLALQENPEEISSVVERLLLEDLTSQT